jgi:chorismate mutase
LIDAEDQIDAIDRRIASYQSRRMEVLKMIASYSESLARRLKAIPSEIIEAEFSEAAE